VPVCRPELELRVADRPQPGKVVVAARVKIHAGERLCMASVEPFRQPHHGRERAHGLAQRPRQVAVPFVRFLRGCLPVVPRQQRDDFNFLRVETAQIAVLDQVVRMAMMALVADMHPDVVQQRAVLEPLALAL